MSDFQSVGPLAYMGKAGCEDVRCRRMLSADGSFGPCLGWHCSYCDQPCSSMGHGCDAATTILAESRRLLDEGAAAVPTDRADG